jgi:hypothetical protein
MGEESHTVWPRVNNQTATAPPWSRSSRSRWAWSRFDLRQPSGRLPLSRSERLDPRQHVFPHPVDSNAPVLGREALEFVIPRAQERKRALRVSPGPMVKSSGELNGSLKKNFFGPGGLQPEALPSLVSFEKFAAIELLDALQESGVQTRLPSAAVFARSGQSPDGGILSQGGDGCNPAVSRFPVAPGAVSGGGVASKHRGGAPG